MQDATSANRFLARVTELTGWNLLVQLAPTLLRLARLVAAFRRAQMSPENMAKFEWDLKQRVNELGRLIVQWTLNDLEPKSRDDLPSNLFWQNDAFRPKRLSPTRNLNCLFGPIRVHRWLYEPSEGSGLPSLFPLERWLGIVAGVATPSLADLVGRLSVDFTQRQVLAALREQAHVVWGTETLRGVTQALAEAIAPFQHAARVELVLRWLRQAAEGIGPVRITLAVGRDGLMLPIRREAKYKEGATATMSVYNRWGKRLGTVYLGQMPEPGQGTLSDELTRLIRDVLSQSVGATPRLVYITDAGHHPRDYFENILSRMMDPHRPGQLLAWEWIVDYYHACGYISELAEAIFGPGREAYCWAAKMRRWLKDKPGGIHRVLRSAGALKTIRGLVGTEKDYQDAYNYLHRHARWMNYAERRRRRTPIGSGVTEAACKTVFTQRFKCSGMKWDIAGGGAVILALRVAVLSKTWSAVRDAMFASYHSTLPRTPTQVYENSLANAA